MSETVIIKTNHEVLKWARTSIVISKQKAAEKIKISLNRLEQLENGDRFPSMDELKNMSKAYKRTIATLLLKSPPKEKPLPADRRTVNSEDLNSFSEKTILAVRKARALTSSFIELKREMNETIPTFEMYAEISDNPKDIAKKLRKDWNITEIKKIDNALTALEILIDFFETKGIAVFQLSLTQDNIRGFSLIDEEMPVIVIKRGGEQATSKNFTLFHELGHIILNNAGICDITLSQKAQDIEKWCNAFAVEMLVPNDNLLQHPIVLDYIRRNAKDWRQKDLIIIGENFHVGPLVILRRLLDNKLTTPVFYRDKHKKWNKPSYGFSKDPKGRDIAKETVDEKGRHYVSLAFKAFDNNKIDLKDLSDFLGVKMQYLTKTRQIANV